jgi:hypothetical protein
MEMRLSRWFEYSLGVERGPLVYALKVEENWKERKTAENDDAFWEVSPTSPWNYGIPAKVIDSLDFSVKEIGQVELMPWNLKNAPLQITTKGKRLPYWDLYENSAGKIPNSSESTRDWDTPTEDIILVPYGCTTMRIAEFPVINR